MRWLALAAPLFALGACEWEIESVDILVWAAVTLAVALIEYRRHVRAAQIEAAAMALAARLQRESEEDDDE